MAKEKIEEIMKSIVFKTYLDVYIPIDKICAFGDDGEGGYGIEVTSGTVYDASEEDINCLKTLISGY